MFGISSFELLIILLVAVVVLGPEKLPKIMRTVTKVMSEFRRVSTDLQRTMNAELTYQEQKEKEEARRKADEARIAALEREQAQLKQAEAAKVEVPADVDAEADAPQSPESETFESKAVSLNSQQTSPKAAMAEQVSNAGAANVTAEKKKADFDESGKAKQA